jgi:hypothetical protein
VGAVLARERALRIGLAEARAGVLEEQENLSKRIKQYQGADSLPGTGYAWCTSFVVWCFREAGRELTETGLSAGVPTTATKGREHGWRRRTPKRGDVVCLQLPTGGLPPVDQTPDHIGIVVEANADGSVRTVEGNVVGPSGGEGVFVMTRPGAQCETILRVPGNVPTGIGRGDHGPKVKEIQRQLVKLGHKRLAIDGDFGEKTEKAVQTFQRRSDLKQTGVATAQTRAAIKRALATPEPSPGGGGTPRPRFIVTATFPDGDTQDSAPLRSRAAVNKQVNAFLTAGAKSVEVSSIP